jgi:hypothetical protein
MEKCGDKEKSIDNDVVDMSLVVDDSTHWLWKRRKRRSITDW